jgi:uncharacterized protein
VRAVATFALALLAPAAQAAVEVPPRPDRYATDHAGVVDAARLSALNETLAQFERDTSNQVLVYVDRRLPAGATVETFATDAFKAWQVGQKDKDNGAVFFVFVDDRQMRIEVGYGLEGALPDLRAARIVDDYAKKHFRANDYAGGVEAAADQIMRAARGEAYQGTGSTQAESGRTRSDGLLPLWFWLVPLLAAGLAVYAALGGATGAERLKRGGATGAVVAFGLSMAAMGLVSDGRVMMLGFGFLLLGLSLVVASLALTAPAHGVAGRRAAGRLLAIGSGSVLVAALGVACFAGAFEVRARFGGFVVLAALLAMPLAGILYARDPEEILTLIVGRLATIGFVISAIFFVVALAFRDPVMRSGLLDWMVPCGLVALACTIYARAKGWRMWPKMESGGSYSGSGYSSGGSWSSGSSSGSSGGSSYSGGGGSSGGGGASGSW